MNEKLTDVNAEEFLPISGFTQRVDMSELAVGDYLYTWPRTAGYPQVYQLMLIDPANGNESAEVGFNYYHRPTGMWLRSTEILRLEGTVLSPDR